MLYDYKFTVVNSPSADCILFNSNFKITFLSQSRFVWPNSKFVLKRENNLIPFWGYFGFNDFDPYRTIKTLVIDDTCTRSVSSYISGGLYDGLTTWLVKLTAGDELYVLTNALPLSNLYNLTNDTIGSNPSFNNPFENRNSSIYLLSSTINYTDLYTSPASG
jgi:hypothetical protein